MWWGSEHPTFSSGCGRDSEDACVPPTHTPPSQCHSTPRLDRDTLLGVRGRRPTSPLCVTVAPRQVLQLPALPTWALRLLGWHLFALPRNEGGRATATGEVSGHSQEGGRGVSPKRVGRPGALEDPRIPLVRRLCFYLSPLEGGRPPFPL